MCADISRDELDRIYKTLDDGFSGVHARLDRMNGRVGEAEQAIAVLKDRSGTGRAAAWGGGIGGVVIAIVEGVKWAIGR